MKAFEAVILAAGLSRRMGAQNKLLLDWNGVPMIAHVVRTYLAAVEGSVTVVTGHEGDRIAAVLDGLPVTILHNADYENGQQSSVVAALSRPSAAQACLLGLGDQPLLRPHDLQWLTAIHLVQDPDKITVPFRGDARGNPIIIPATLRTQILANPQKAGCRHFTRDTPALVSKATDAAPAFFGDVDTAEDYAALIAKSGEPHETPF